MAASKLYSTLPGTIIACPGELDPAVVDPPLAAISLLYGLHMIVTVYVLGDKDEVRRVNTVLDNVSARV